MHHALHHCSPYCARARIISLPLRLFSIVSTSAERGQAGGVGEREGRPFEMRGMHVQPRAGGWSRRAGWQALCRSTASEVATLCEQAGGRMRCRLTVQAVNGAHDLLKVAVAQVGHHLRIWCADWGTAGGVLGSRGGRGRTCWSNTSSRLRPAALCSC